MSKNKLLKIRFELYLYPFILMLVLFGFTGCHQKDKPADQIKLKLVSQKSGTHALLVGISVVSMDVVWVSGAGGTILRTTDGGKTWQPRPITGTDSLQFRDVHAVSVDTAYVLSIGKKGKSRIYKTIDSGASWTLQFKSNIAEAFFDCMAFWTPQAGLAFSDAVNGKFIVIKTANGGQTWERIPAKQLPSAREGEGSFAASGTCVEVEGDSTAWIAAGGTKRPRILKTSDRGQTWQSFSVPVDAGSGAGGASIIFRDANHGFILGGSITHPRSSDSTAAITNDGGKLWELAGNPLPNSPVYGSAYIPGTGNVVAVGPAGVAFSTDEGRSWQRVDTTDTWAVSFAAPDEGWLVGPDGRIVHVSVE